jgi:hypothetical protein
MHTQTQILLYSVIFLGRLAFAIFSTFSIQLFCNLYDSQENKEKASSDSGSGSASAEARRPNILLIVADDIGKQYSKEKNKK